MSSRVLFFGVTVGFGAGHYLFDRKGYVSDRDRWAILPEPLHRLDGLADEIRRMLDEGVASAPEDIDLAMITGAGFQFWNGGITQLLDREGISEKVTGRKFH